MVRDHEMKPDFSETNIVHVVRQYAPNIGGLEDFVRNLVAHQKDRFASVKVVTLNQIFSAPGKVLPPNEIIDGVEVQRIPFSGSSRYPVAPGVFKCIAGADLVHVHAIDFFFDALALARIWHRKPLVATTHGGFFHTRKFRMLKTIWFNTLTRVSAAQYKEIACCSQSDLDQFTRIAPSRTTLIENGVNLEKFAEASSRIPVKRMVTIGRFSNNKKLDRVLDVLKCLKADSGKNGLSWHLDIVGIESDWRESDLRKMIAERNLEAQVRLLIGLPDSGVREAINQASFFVSASTYEGFGIALIEAMSAGLVPIVHSNDAFRELARKHRQISLADYSEPEEVAAVLVRCWAELQRNKELRQDLITEAGGYGWAATAERYGELYTRALGL
jgi:alpha-1,3-mannosyltransferase